MSQIPNKVRVPLDDHLIDANINLEMYHINGDIVIQGLDDADMDSDFISCDVPSGLAKDIQTRYAKSVPVKRFHFIAEEASGGMDLLSEDGSLIRPEAKTERSLSRSGS